MELFQILDRIISKGGLIGACAKYYSGNPEKANQFIFECYQKCRHQSAVQFWGEELVIDIQNYIHSVAAKN